MCRNFRHASLGALLLVIACSAGTAGTLNLQSLLYSNYAPSTPNPAPTPPPAPPPAPVVTPPSPPASSNSTSAGSSGSDTGGGASENALLNRLLNKGKNNPPPAPPPPSGGPGRAAELSGATQTGSGLKNPDADDLNGYFSGISGTWGKVGDLNEKTALSDGLFFSIAFINGSGWDGNPGINGPAVSGTWSIAPSFWDTHSSAAITMHVGNGNDSPESNPDHWAWLIPYGSTSGTWAYTLNSGNGGGLSNLMLWGVKKNNLVPPPPPPPPAVPESASTLLLLGGACAAFHTIRRRLR